MLRLFFLPSPCHCVSHLIVVRQVTSLFRGSQSRRRKNLYFFGTLLLAFSKHEVKWPAIKNVSAEKQKRISIIGFCRLEKKSFLKNCVMYSPREEVTAGRTERCNHATYYLVRLMKVIATRFCVTRAASVDTFLSSPHFISFFKFHRTWCTSRFFYLLFLWRRQRKSTSRPIVSSSFDSKHSLDWFVIYSSGHEMMSSHFHLGPGHNVESEFVTLHLL